MKLQCKECGDWFKVPKEDQIAAGNGEYELTHICDECLDMMNQLPDIDSYSDADCGL